MSDLAFCVEFRTNARLHNRRPSPASSHTSRETDVFPGGDNGGSGKDGGGAAAAADCGDSTPTRSIQATSGATNSGATNERAASAPARAAPAAVTAPAPSARAAAVTCARRATSTLSTAS